MTTGEKVLDLNLIENLVVAASRQLGERRSEFRKLQARSAGEYDRSSSWMLPLKSPSREVYAVELVRCDGDDPQGVLLDQHHQNPEQARSDALALYELWVEELPAGALYDG